MIVCREGVEKKGREQHIKPVQLDKFFHALLFVIRNVCRVCACMWILRIATMYLDVIYLKQKAVGTEEV